MTTRIYYTDPYCSEFDAAVAAVEREAERTIVQLDRTAFYPTTGGQPFDTGFLNDTKVVDVIERDDGTVAHVIEGSLSAGATVRGRIDWERRFDHMQQHTGQHILSAAFVRLLGVPTLSFHLGATVSTIDLARPVDAKEVALAESEANRIVWEDRAVTIRFATEEEAATLPLRKEPVRGGTLRLIEVQDFDLSACGGTHVGRTGAIGIIAVAGAERFKGGTRVEFVCGGRALRDLRALRASVTASLRLLSVLPEELPGAVERLQAEMRDLRKASQAMQERLAAHEAEALATRAEPVGGLQLVLAAVDGWDAASLKGMATAVTTRPAHVAILTSAASPFLIVVSRSTDVAIDAGTILRTLTGRFGGRGGGRPELAQGGGLTGPLPELLGAARQLVEASQHPRASPD